MIVELSLAAWLPFVGLPLVLGACVLRLCGVRWHDDRLAFAAWTWPAGAFTLGIVLLASLLLGVEPAHWLAAAAVASTIVAAIAIRHRAPPTPPAPRPRDAGAPWFWLVTALGLATLALAAASAAAEPCVIGDEGSLWAMKARAFSYDWFHGDFVHAQNLSTHADYPPLNPLLQAWSHALAGGFTLFENRAPIQLCTLSLWLATAAALRRHAPTWLATLLLLVFLLDPFTHAAALAAEADTMVALGLVLALDGWLRAQESGGRGPRAVAALGLGFALWTKNEAAMYLAAALAAAAGIAIATRRAPRRPPTWLALPLAVVAWQWAWNRWFHFQNDLVGGNPLGKSFRELFVAQFADRVGPAFAEGLRLLTRWDRAHGVLLLVLLLPLLWPRAALARPLGVVTLALLGALLGTHLVYVGSWLELTYHLTTSHARVLYQLVPVAMIWFGALLRGIAPPPPAAA